MPFIKCPHCDSSVKVPENSGGRRGKCTVCGERVLIPHFTSAVIPEAIPIAIASAAAAAPALPAEEGLLDASRWQPVPAPYSPAVKPAPAASRKRGRGVLVTFTLFALIGAGAWMYLREQPRARATTHHFFLQSAQFAPASCTVFGAADLVAMNDVNIELNKLLDGASPRINKMVQQREESLRKNCGFDIRDARAWAEAGIDVRQPVTAALMIAPDLTSQRIVMSIGVVDGDRAKLTVQRVLKDSLILVTETKRAKSEAHFVFQQKPGRLFFTESDDSEKGSAALQKYLDDTESNPLNRNEAFTAALNALPRGGEYLLYANPQPIWRTQFEVIPPMLKTVRGVALTSVNMEKSMFVLCNAENKLLSVLTPGGECREFLGKLEKPLGVVTWSISDPAALWEYAMESSGNSSDWKARASEKLGAPIEELLPILRDSAGGVAFYPTDVKGEWVSYINFIKLRSREDFEKFVSKLPATTQARITKKFGNNWISIENGFAMGLVDNYMVFGKALDPFETLVFGTAQPWEPTIGGRNTISAEINLSLIFKHVYRSDEEMMKFFGDAKAADLRVAVSLEVRDNGLLIHTTQSGVDKNLVLLAEKLLEAFETRPLFPVSAPAIAR